MAVWAQDGKICEASFDGFLYRSQWNAMVDFADVAFQKREGTSGLESAALALQEANVSQNCFLLSPDQRPISFAPEVGV